MATSHFLVGVNVAPRRRTTRRVAALKSSLVSIALPCSSGLLLAAAFPPINFHWLAWCSLLPFGVAAGRRSASLELYLGTYLGGLLFHLVGIDWMRTASAGTWLDGPRALSWFLTGQSMATSWLVAIWCARRLVLGRASPMALALPLAWLTAEYFRLYLGVFVAGTQFPWLQLGHSQVQVLPLIQIADIAGVWGVSALVAAVGGGLYDALSVATRPSDRRYVRRAALSCACVTVLLATAWLYGKWRLSQPIERNGPVVYLMTASMIPRARTADSAQATIRALSEIAVMADRPASNCSTAAPPDLLLWSEQVYGTPLVDWAPGVRRLPLSELPYDASQLLTEDVIRRQPGILTALERYARTANATIVLGCSRVWLSHERGTRYNSTAIFDARRGHVGYYDKSYLVPWNEYTPWLRVPGLVPISVPYKSGDRCPLFSVRTRHSMRDCHFGTTICYDTCFPSLHRRYVRSAAGSPDFFVTSSCELIDATKRLADAILTMAQFRAIECRRAIVRNVEGGHSGVIDGSGRFALAPSADEINRPVSVGRVPLDRRVSLYAYLGDWLPIVASLIVGLGAFSGRPSSRFRRFVQRGAIRAKIV